MSGNWMKVLRTESDKRGQAAVGRLIGYSPTVVNQVLKGTYKGDLRRVELAVRGALLKETVNCPVLGDIPGNECLQHQARPFSASNINRTLLYNACRDGCVHSLIPEGKKHADIT